MESITKNRQPLDTLRAMVARAYGEDQVPSGTAAWVHELGHGWFNVAYRLRLRDGYQAVLKVAPPAGVEVMTYERQAMATELAALSLLAGVDVPVPRVDFADSSRTLVDADWFVTRYVDADNYGLIRSSLSASNPPSATPQPSSAATAEPGSPRPSAPAASTTST